MPSPSTGILLLVTAVLVCVVVSAYDKDMVKKRNFYRRQRPRQFRHRYEDISHSQLPGVGPTWDNTSEWARSFIPDRPSEENVDCNIEIEVTQVMGGRCVRLYGQQRLAVCQSGMYLDVNSEECQNILNNREMTELQQLQALLQQLEQMGPSQNAAGSSAAQPENGLTETQQAADTE